MIYRNNEVTLVRHVYNGNGNLSILMMAKDGTVFTVVSRNVVPLESNQFAIDINNNLDIGTWLKKNGIAKDTHYLAESGSLTYPVYELLIELPSLELYRKAHESNLFTEV